MSTACVVCVNKGIKHPNSNVYSLHAFPSCPKRRQTWLNQCGLSDKEFLPNHKICAFHFEPKCFKSGVTRRILYPTAVPTIFGNGHVETATLPLKNVEGGPNNHNKNGIVDQNCASRVVTPRIDENEDFDHINSELEKQMAEYNKLEGILDKLNKEKSALESQLRTLIMDQITLQDLLN